MGLLASVHLNTKNASFHPPKQLPLATKLTQEDKVGFHRISMLLALILLTSVEVNAAATNSLAVYEVKGQAQFTAFIDKKPIKQPLVNFSLAVSNRLYAIRIRMEGERASDYQEITFDGVRQYFIDCFKGALANSKITSTVQNVANARIELDEIPRIVCSPEFGPIWLAFASGAFFADSDQVLLAPPLPMDCLGNKYDSKPIRQLQVRFEQQKEGLRLPSLMVFTEPGGLQVMQPGTKQAPTYDVGFTNCVYSITSLTNCNGIVLPRSAVLQLYAPKLNGNSQQDLELVGIYDMALSEFKKGTDLSSFQPSIPGVTFVTDTSLASTYVLTNSWPEMTKAKKPPFRN